MRDLGQEKAVVVNKQIEIDSIVRRDLLALDLARGKAHRIHVLRLLAREMGVGVRKDEDTVVSVDRVKLSKGYPASNR
jgi:hypothetical protein